MIRGMIFAAVVLVGLAPASHASLLFARVYTHYSLNDSSIGFFEQTWTEFGDPEVWGGHSLVSTSTGPVEGAYILTIQFQSDVVNTWGEPGIEFYDYGSPIYDFVNFSASGHWSVGVYDYGTGIGGIVETGSFELTGELIPYRQHPLVHFNLTAMADPGSVELPNGLGPIDFSDWQFYIDQTMDTDGQQGYFYIYADPKPADVVPEPATATLLFGGLGLLAWAKRRRGSAVT